MARTREDAVANPVREGLTPGLLEACISITIVDDLIGEGSERLLLGLELSLENSNVNAVGCPATATIQDRRMYTFRTDIIYVCNQDRYNIHSGQTYIYIHSGHT